MLHVILSVLPINFKIAADNCKSSNSKHTYFRPVHVAFFAEDINATEQTKAQHKYSAHNYVHHLLSPLISLMIQFYFVLLSILLVHAFLTNSLWKGSTIWVQCH